MHSLCIVHSHVSPSVVAVKKGLNTQVGLVLKMNLYLHQTWFDRPPASSGTTGVPFCDHLLQNKKPSPLLPAHRK